MGKLFSVYIRPGLEYVSQVWGPSRKCENVVIKFILRHYSRRILKLRHLLYADTSSALSLKSMEHRRQLLDLSLFYKNVIRINNNRSILFWIKYGNISFVRAAGSVLHYPSCHFSLSCNFYPYRSVRTWNSLAQHIYRS